MCVLAAALRARDGNDACASLQRAQAMVTSPAGAALYWRTPTPSPPRTPPLPLPPLPLPSPPPDRAVCPTVTTAEGLWTTIAELADVNASDMMLDIGCGDGRFIAHVAHTCRCRCIGIDVVPSCLLSTRRSAHRWGVQHLVEAVDQDMMDLVGLQRFVARATVVYAFLLPHIIRKIEPVLLKAVADGKRVVLFCANSASSRSSLGDLVPSRQAWFGRLRCYGRRRAAAPLHVSPHDDELPRATVAPARSVLAEMASMPAAPESEALPLVPTAAALAKGATTGCDDMAHSSRALPPSRTDSDISLPTTPTSPSLPSPPPPPPAGAHESLAFAPRPAKNTRTRPDDVLVQRILVHDLAAASTTTVIASSAPLAPHAYTRGKAIREVSREQLITQCERERLAQYRRSCCRTEKLHGLVPHAPNAARIGYDWDAHTPEVLHGTSDWDSTPIRTISITPTHNHGHMPASIPPASLARWEWIAPRRPTTTVGTVLASVPSLKCQLQQRRAAVLQRRAAVDTARQRLETFRALRHKRVQL